MQRPTRIVGYLKPHVVGISEVLFVHFPLRLIPSRSCPPLAVIHPGVLHKLQSIPNLVNESHDAASELVFHAPTQLLTPCSQSETSDDQSTNRAYGGNSVRDARNGFRIHLINITAA